MSAADLQGLYQELILDHAKTPSGTGLMESADGQSHQLNPTCGDEITLQVHLGEGDTVAHLRWQGHGCAISQASASLLSELAEGLSTAELTERIDAFRTA
ncbi:iron-sulfur cluster assembly scaffold protein, partial [Citricoccus sp.]